MLVGNMTAVDRDRGISMQDHGQLSITSACRHVGISDYSFAKPKAGFREAEMPHPFLHIILARLNFLVQQ